ncbi:ABC transporter ATP-binding protein [Desulforegula conservatrix]|uniref:ABC transporter ATP-binding protein n=1 Tax=Desulforegula conservatrix TaxID=153026 RepID=UPI0003FB4336|nr:ATP-binding cassette domain-containing protein [Desulforegula conservatrix]
MTIKPKPIITVKNLTAAYGGNTILENISFDVYPGEIFIILGGSGCGKSTLMKHVIGLYPPVTGEVLIEGQDLVSARGDKRKEILSRLGVMYQSGALFGSMNILENVRLPLEEFTNLPKRVMNTIACNMLDRVGLGDYTEYLPSEISGGMQKRAAIARAMALDPSIIFLDEPSAGLDPITSAELDDLILSLSREFGVTFIIVTHELPSIFAICDRSIMLDKVTKGIVAEGKPLELKKRNDMPAVYAFFNRVPMNDNKDSSD